MKATKENLRQHATEPLAQWLIQKAKDRSWMPYGEAKRQLEASIGFDTIFSIHMGTPAGELMDQMLRVRPDCPLLNVLLVRQEDGLPGSGAGSYMARYLNQPEFAEKNFRDRYPRKWRAAFDKIASDVYAFRDWNLVYQEAFGRSLPAVPAYGDSTERDGINHHARGGEGPNHKALRLWVKNNASEISSNYGGFRTKTEVILDSADRVDVVYYGPDSTVVIEAKSVDSNEADLRRGVFQCIKYRAVMKAMDARKNASVIPVLVTQANLPGDLAAVCRRHKIRHFRAPKQLPFVSPKRRSPS